VLTGDVAERYTVEDELGRGGTSIVYRARDRASGGFVAIKILREDVVGALSIVRFLREIRVTAQLAHANIVPVLDSGEHEGRPYCVLPLLDGGTLRRRLAREKQLPLADVVALGVTMCGALEFAHGNGLIHRDVKPENILFKDGQPCLADFGTARALERATNDPTTSTGIVRGTPAYMSPEQASGEQEYDGRSDIYSLGCVLYEAVAGMQPFVGPTSQAVIAQRLTHMPRPVSVYRPTVPPELEAVLAKAVAIAPADRYQTAGEFATALESVVPVLGRPSHATYGVTRWSTARVRGLGVAAAVTIIVVAAVVSRTGIQLPFFSPALSGDTTLVAIMPVEATGASEQIAGQELFAEGLRGWSGVSPVETFATNDALKRAGRGETPGAVVRSLSIGEIVAIASGLGAGRVIKSQVTNASGLHSVYATLYDVRSGKDLHHARVLLPTDTTKWLDAYADLTDSLMLRGAKDGRPRSSRLSPRSLPGYQAFLVARGSLGEWDLPRAESLFAVSVAYDSTLARARLWLAQVRSWQNRPVQTWARDAQRANEATDGLTRTERRQVLALASMGLGDFDRACAIYRSIADSVPQDFTGWYGLGDCHRLDRIVVRDSSSRSGWRYRSSYHQAIKAYQRAFEVLPSSYKTVEVKAFEPLRRFLFTSGAMRRGQVPAGPADGFLSRAALEADSIVFVPYPIEIVRTGVAMNQPAAEERAWQHTRGVFMGIVAKWNQAFPQSAVVKEGVAVSLEILGDPAAADSFRAARVLTRDRTLRLRLAVEEAIARIKMAVAQRPESLANARRLADSVLATPGVVNIDDAELLARLAAVTGRCAAAGRFARLIAAPFSQVQIPASIASDAQATFAEAATGCQNDLQLAHFTDRLRRSGTSFKNIKLYEYQAFSPVLGMRYPGEATAIQQFADTAGDFVLATELFLLNGDTARARATLTPPSTALLLRSGGDVALDATVNVARLWLALGDTATATKLLDQSLTGLRYTQPLAADQFATNQLRLGAIGAAMELRANLAVHDTATRRRWARAAIELWANADPDIQVRVTRLKAISR